MCLFGVKSRQNSTAIKLKISDYESVQWSMGLLRLIIVTKYIKFTM